MLSKALLSVCITVFVSVILGICGYVWFSAFWLWFVVGTIAQFVIFFIFNTVYGNYIKIRAENLKIEQLKHISDLTAYPQCPCGNNTQPVLFKSFSEIVEYKCDKCDKTIKAQPNVVTVLVSEPVDHVRTR